MSYLLGISAFYHDSAASLLKNGEILSAVQEERFSRKKHDNKFPINAIKYLLTEHKISLKDIDAVVFYEKPFLKFERLLETYIAFAPKGIKSFCASIPIWLREKLYQKKMIFDELKKIDIHFDIKKIKFCQHHLSHAASAFFPSPFDNAIILTLDGVGELATTVVAEGRNNSIEIKKEIHFPHSLGLIYSAFTYYLGFKVNSGEYKVMGLAPYGKTKFKETIFKNLIDLKEDGSFRLNMKYFDFTTDLKMTNKNFNNLFSHEPRIPEKDKLNQFHMDIAASIQAVTEEVVLKILKNIKKEYNPKNLCLAGGVALNCVANGKILKENLFENIWIQPAAGDAGGSLGAALAYWHCEKKEKRKINTEDKMKGSYLGPEFKDEEIEKKLIELGANFKKYNQEELLRKTVSDLINQKAIGWFQGRMEFGPRALGARSIIADPRSSEMQKNLNLKVKYRESFRPFAPAILKEDLSEYFDLKIESPYMLFVSKVADKIKYNTSKKEEEENIASIERINLERSTVPSVTHVDYSARIQTVKQNNNPIFYNLLKEFKKQTGCSVLINTSFNIRGEPIVCSPKDAYKCFMGTELDTLVIGSFFLRKENQILSNKKDYKNQFELD